MSRAGGVLCGLAALIACLTVACGGADEPASEAQAGAPVVMLRTPTPEPTPTRTLEPPATPSPVPTVLRPRFVSLADLTSDVPVPPLPTSFAAPAPDAGLDAVLRLALKGRKGSYSVVIHNLADGRYAALNGDKVYYAASLFKMGLLLEAYRQRDAGELDFQKKLTLSKKYVEYDLGTLKYLGLREGDTITLEDAIKAMIVVSDTPSAVMVQDTVKPSRVDATLRSLGIANTSFNDYDLPATAADMARLLEAIAAGQGVSAPSREEMLSLLLQEWVREGVPAGVPAEVAVAHKSGSYQQATHDVALVWGPAGPYVIAVMTDQSYDFKAVREVSRVVWDYFAKHP